MEKYRRVVHLLPLYNFVHTSGYSIYPRNPSSQSQYFPAYRRIKFKPFSLLFPPSCAQFDRKSPTALVEFQSIPKSSYKYSCQGPTMPVANVPRDYRDHVYVLNHISHSTSGIRKTAQRGSTARLEVLQLRACQPSFDRHSMEGMGRNLGQHHIAATDKTLNFSCLPSSSIFPSLLFSARSSTISMITLPTAVTSEMKYGAIIKCNANDAM